MAPPKKTFKATEAVAYAGAEGIHKFFPPKPIPKKAGRPKEKRGRRPKKAGTTSVIPPIAVAANPQGNSKRGRTDDDDIPDGDKKPAAKPPPAEPPAEKKTRINWSIGEHRDKMEQAIEDWTDKVGQVYDDNGEEITDHRVFAALFGIPEKTFYKYIHPDPMKRRMSIPLLQKSLLFSLPSGLGCSPVRGKL